MSFRKRDLPHGSVLDRGKERRRETSEEDCVSRARTIHEERQVEIGTARESTIRNGGAEWIDPDRARECDFFASRGAPRSVR